MAIKHRLRRIVVCGVFSCAASFAAQAADVDAAAQPFERFSAARTGASAAYKIDWMASGAAMAPHLFSAQQQDATQSSGQASPQQTSQTNQPNGQGEVHSNGTGKTDDRLFFALPNFLTVENASDVPRMTAKQKFKVVARSAFDYTEFPWYAALAGISQAENSEPGYGQGLKGYAKRYGAAFGDGTIENFWVSAIFPSILHEDPRFYQMPTGSIMHRAVYAASRMLITRTDAGHRTFNFSEVLGAMVAATISTYSYHPRADHTIGNAASVWGSEIGYDTVTIEIKEFWPAVHGAIARKKAASTAPAQP